MKFNIVTKKSGNKIVTLFCRIAASCFASVVGVFCGCCSWLSFWGAVGVFVWRVLGFNLGCVSGCVSGCVLGSFLCGVFLCAVVCCACW